MNKDVNKKNAYTSGYKHAHTYKQTIKHIENERAHANIHAHVHLLSPYDVLMVINFAAKKRRNIGCNCPKSISYLIAILSFTYDHKIINKNAEK